MITTTPRKHKFLKFLAYAFFYGSIFTLAFTTFVFFWFGSDLPNYEKLSTYRPSVSSRFYAGNGDLLTEYAVEKRLYVEYKDLPKQLIESFIAAEDQNFWTHHGIDLFGVARALITNIGMKLSGSDGRTGGASTITQQVARNFFLSSERSFARKIKEVILALRLERSFSKEHIMMLYLNKIYLGYHAYGVAAASQSYFDKSLDALTLSEMAFLAALPKAPNNYNPITRYEKALGRRNWVLSRMEIEGFITKEEMKAAQETPIKVSDKFKNNLSQYAQYYSEEVRKFLSERFPEEVLYQEGLAVHTTMKPTFQRAALMAVRNGVLQYDKDHGWRGPVTHVNLKEDWHKQLMQYDRPLGMPQGWRLGIALSMDAEKAMIGLPDQKIAALPLSNLAWARQNLPTNQTLGPKVTAPSDVLKQGDIILVEETETGDLTLHQQPNVEAGMIVLNPQTGEVYALVGGFSFEQSPFNRATQALRQIGSTIKPFVYMTALERPDYSPFTRILDAPVVMERTDTEGLWKPENYEQNFKGELPLRRCLELSRNAPTVRIADAIGVQPIADTLKKFGLYDEDEKLTDKGLSLALGTGETTLIRLTNAYAMIANGGRKITPYMVEKVHDRDGKLVYAKDEKCEDCHVEKFSPNMLPPQIAHQDEIIFPQTTTYQMVNILKGVIQRGTGTRARIEGYNLAGKTGTSDDYKDAWFVGILPNLAVGVFFGFDQPRTLGRGYAGGTLAAPVFKEFFTTIKNEVPVKDFPVPEGIGFMNLDKNTGYLATEKTPPEDIVREALTAEDMQRVSQPPVKQNVEDGDETTTPVQNYDADLGEVY
ncbi:MAG: PBP1A family penicillin-binding protein [Alphaproteobacteria bacterium]|nr:PBP1A family penicillin-binding protein [Alphaproteobacteria bacterium]MBN2779460.1 PBP1A family penicillin-binding protein [Alphaproteobacteria bacterium]